MSDSEFIITILASIGCFFLINRMVLALGRPILAALKKRQLSGAYSSAYQKESPTQVNDANLKLAYEKLENLATTKKSYASRKGDIQFAKELGIPANDKLVKLLVNALANQNQQETIDLLSDYLQWTRDEIKKSKSGKHNGSASNVPAPAWLSNAGLTGISILLMELLLLIYLVRRADDLKSNQIMILSIYLILVTALALHRLNVGTRMMLSLSVLLVLLILYGYSTRYHGNNEKRHTDPGFDGYVDCPEWLRADETCSAPIMIHPNSSTDVTLKIDEPGGIASFRENEKDCMKPGASEFIVSSRQPYGFRLQAIDKDVFRKDNQIVTLKFQKVESNGTVVPLDGLTCEIRVEEKVWADARQPILGIAGLTGAVTLLQIVVALWKKPVTRAAGID